MDKTQPIHNICQPHAHDKPVYKNICHEFEPGTNIKRTDYDVGDIHVSNPLGFSKNLDKETVDKLQIQNTNHVLTGSATQFSGKTVISKNISEKPRTVTLLKGSGFRHRNCVMPVNRQTAIHLPRLTNVPIEKLTAMHVTYPVNDQDSMHAKICIPISKNNEGRNVLVSDEVRQQRIVHHNRRGESTVHKHPSQLSSDTIVSLLNTNRPQVKFASKTDSKKTTVNKRASLIKDPNNESTIHEKKQKLDSGSKNVSEPAYSKCKNNNSMIKTNNSSTSLSDETSYNNLSIMSNKTSTEQFHLVLNKLSDEEQHDFYSATNENVASRDGQKKIMSGLLSTKSRDVKLDIALSSTSTCLDEFGVNRLEAEQSETKNSIEQSNTTISESDNVTDHIATVGSEDSNVPSMSGLRKNKKRKKDKMGKSDIARLLNEQKCSDVKLPKISETKASFNQRSKSLYDLESRYKMRSNEEILYRDESDVICQVEAHKLSSVKDHRLLTLSEDEKAFLRSKSYLNDDVTDDVKRRFGPKKINNYVGKSTQHQSFELNKISESTPKGKVGEDVKLGSTSTSMKLDEYNKAVSEIRQDHPQIRVVIPGEIPKNIKANTGRSGYMSPQQPVIIPGEILQNTKANSGRAGYMSPQQPVIKLQRIDKQLQMTTPTAKDEQTKHYTTDSSYQSNNKINTNKVYYVINKDDLSQIKTQANIKSDKKTQLDVTFSSTPRVPSSIRHTIKTQAKTLSTDQNNVNQANGRIELVTRAKPSKTEKKQDRKPVNRKLHSEVDSVTIGQSFESSGSNHKTEQIPSTSAINSNYKPLTVKDLLELKRKNMEPKVTLFRSTTPLVPRQVGNMPIVFSERAVRGFPLNESVLVHESLKDGNRCQPEWPVDQQKSKLVINFVNPSNISTVPVSVAQTPVQTNTSLLETSQIIPNDSPTNKKMHIKIGEGTMIVRNCPRKDKINRKTLPAPKPKHKIADDYKRRRRRLSKSRKMIIANQRCLQARLKKLLMKSEDSLHKLAQTLDLVPLDLLKQALSQPSTEHESKVPNKSIAQYDAKLMHVAGASNDYLDSSTDMTEDHKREMPIIPSVDLANIIQIFRGVDGSFSYDKHHVQIKYRHYDEPAADHTTQSEFPCRLKFDENGKLQKISIETLHRGIYLINKRGLDPNVVRNKRVFNLNLVVYPPHAAVLPYGSVAFAVGEIFSSTQRDLCKYQCDQTCLPDLQEELQQFIWPYTMDNVDELTDGRYGSVTERSLSPRCCSPMFYTRAMGCAFDQSANVVESDTSSEDLTAEKNTSVKRPDNRLDCQTVRFSERAMALKVKQNELFETCRKLKSQQSNNIEPKKKRRKLKKSEDPCTRPQYSEQRLEVIQTDTDAVQGTVRIHENQFVNGLVDSKVEIHHLDTYIE